MTSRATGNGNHLTGPPPNHHHHQYYPTSSSSSSKASFKGCCCCLFLLFAFLALLLLAVVLVIVLAVKPKKPQFDLQQVGVQYVGISSAPSETAAATATAAAESASLSLNIRMQFTAANPNKVGIRYGESRFTVMYRGIPLGRASVPGFFQPAHSVREISTTVAVDRVNLLQADAADLVKDASLNDRVELRVLGDVRAKIHVLSFDSPGVQVCFFSCKIFPLRLFISLWSYSFGVSPNLLENFFVFPHLFSALPFFFLCLTPYAMEG